MILLIACYLSGAALLTFLAVLVHLTTESKFNTGWASFILLWPFALPYNAAVILLNRGGK